MVLPSQSWQSPHLPWQSKDTIGSNPNESRHAWQRSGKHIGRGDGAFLKWWWKIVPNLHHFCCYSNFKSTKNVWIGEIRCRIRVIWISRTLWEARAEENKNAGNSNSTIPIASITIFIHSLWFCFSYWGDKAVLPLEATKGVAEPEFAYGSVETVGEAVGAP